MSNALPQSRGPGRLIGTGDRPKPDRDPVPGVDGDDNERQIDLSVPNIHAAFGR